MKIRQSTYILITFIIAICSPIIYFILYMLNEFLLINVMPFAIILSIIPLILSIIELFIYKRKKIAKNIIVLMFSIFLLITGLSDTNGEYSNVLYFIASGILFSIAMSITLLISFILSRRIEKKYGVNKVEEEHVIGNLHIHYGKSNPLGWLKNKTYKISNVISITFTIVLILITILLIFLQQFDSIIMFAICFGILGITIPLLINNKDFKIFLDFEKSLENFDKVKKYIFYLIDNEPLHPETKNYLMILYANYAGIYSKDDRNVALSMCKAPTYITYRIIYDSLLYLNSDLPYEGKKELLNTLFNDSYYKSNKTNYKKALKILNKLLRENDLIHNKLVMDPNKDFTWIKNNKLSYLSSLYAKFKYFYNRNDLEKAKIIKEEILKVGSKCTQLIKEINEYFVE